MKNIAMFKYKSGLPLAVIGAFFLAHCLLILLPSINLEFAFVDAAHYFQTGNSSLIEQYFRFQANTLGLPYLSWLISFFSPNLDMLFVIRLLSASGIVLLGLGVINFCKFLGRDDAIKLLILILLNPLVWVFSGRATADFLPAALGFYSITILLKNRTIFHIFCAGTLLGIATILKYHAIFLLLVLIPCLWDSKNKLFDIKPFLMVSAISLTLLSIFLFIVHQNFGFWVAPPIYQSIHGLNFRSFLNNFFLYIGFLILLCAPQSLIFPGWKKLLIKHRYLIIFGSAAIFFLGSIGFQDGGELNLGPLDRFINKNAMAGIFLLFSLFFLTPFLATQENITVKKFNSLLAISIILIISAFSLTRPAQRYLLVVIPFFYFLVPQRVINNKKVIIVSVFMYTMINIFIGYSQWNTGSAAEKMVYAIRVAGLIDVTNPGIIEGHVGNQFNINVRGDSKYVVILGDDPAARIKVESGVSFSKKTFSLVEISRQDPR